MKFASYKSSYWCMNINLRTFLHIRKNYQVDRWSFPIWMTIDLPRIIADPSVEKSYPYTFSGTSIFREMGEWPGRNCDHTGGGPIALLDQTSNGIEWTSNCLKCHSITKLPDLESLRWSGRARRWIKNRKLVCGSRYRVISELSVIHKRISTNPTGRKLGSLKKGCTNGSEIRCLLICLIITTHE